MRLVHAFIGILLTAAKQLSVAPLADLCILVLVLIYSISGGPRSINYDPNPNFIDIHLIPANGLLLSAGWRCCGVGRLNETL